MTLELPVAEISCQFGEVDGYDRITLSSGIVLGAPGTPELPAVTFSYAIPPDQSASGIKIIDISWQEVPGSFNIYPRQEPAAIEDSSAFTVPDTSIYHSSRPFPDSVIAGYSCGNLRGNKIVSISVVPFRYYPALRRLDRLASLRVEIKTVRADPGISPLRQSSLSGSLFTKFIYASVLNDADLAKYRNSRTEENPEDLAPTELPSLLGPPVDLLIITDEDMVSAYDQFARFKKLFGFNTAIRTMTWIKAHYNGFDDAERARNFIRDAVGQWGVSFVLLGSDVPGIPIRWVWVESLYGLRPVHTATDLYYSDLDGNWNFDGDDRFGEVSDSVDLYPDVFVGRIPAHGPGDISAYLDKIRSYLLDPKIPPSGAPGFQSKALFVSSMFWNWNDSYYVAGRLSERLPSHMYRKFLNEMPKQDFLEAIYEGYNIITFLAHGDVNLMRVRTTPRENVSNFDYDSLTNDIYPLMLVLTCYAGPFQEDCLGEHWVMNPHGGGIAFIGPTSSSSASDHEEYMKSLIDSLFRFPLAGALGYSKIPFIGSSQLDTWNRVFQYSLNVLGDPAIDIWERMPQDLISIAVSPETIMVGNDTISVALNPQVDTFLVIFNKENELFKKDTGYAGTAQTPVRTKSAGYLRYSILANGYITHIDSIIVAASKPYPVFNSLTIIDTSGNGNGNSAVNPGEDVNMDIRLANNGGSAATGVFVQISCADSFVTMIDSSAAYPDLAPGDTAANLAPFRFKVTNRIPDEHSFNFSLTVNCDSGQVPDTCQVVASAPRLELLTHNYEVVGDRAWIIPYVQNLGHCAAESAVGIISAYSDTIQLLDSTVSFPVIDPNKISPAIDSYMIQLSLPGTIAFNSQVLNLGFEACSRKIIQTTPPKTDSIWAYGTPLSIIVDWLQVPGSIGYRVFRAMSLSGPYQFLQNPLEPVGHYEDNSASQSIPYYYYVCTVDSFLNESPPSETICALTNPPAASGWPRTVYGYLFASPNFFDIDPDYPGLEIVACAKNGGVYAWHYDGTPVTGDGRIFQCNYEIWSSPAIGDMNNDGAAEIVFGIRGPGNNIQVLTRSDTSWIPLTGWPKYLDGGVLSSPVLSDIDEDGDLELFVSAEYGLLYAFHHTGCGVFSPGGEFKQLYGCSYGTPAIGDINDDGDLEIIACGGTESDSLFVWNRFGEYLYPFPIRVMPKMSYSPVLGDIIGDDRLEICFFTDSLEFVHVVDASGNILWQNYILALGDIEASPILANVTGNARPEVICANNQGFQVMSVFDSLGTQATGFPPAFGYDYKLPIAADADGNGSADIICGSADWNLYAIGNHGQLVKGFPIHFGIRIEMSPAVYDIDLDGKLELMVGAHDFKFWVFDLESQTFEWPKFRYDHYNTGNYGSANLGQNEHMLAKNSTGEFSFQVFPNPFRKNLAIKLQIPNSKLQTNSISKIPIPNQVQGKTQALLKVFDISGRLVKSFDLSSCRSLLSTIIWNGEDDLGRRVPSGVYFVRFNSDNYKQVKKVVLLK